MRYSVGREGIWSLLGVAGTSTPGQADIDKLYDNDYVASAFNLTEFTGVPHAQVGHRVNPHYQTGNMILINIGTNVTRFLINNAESGDFYQLNDATHNRVHIETGTTALLTQWGWYGTASAIGKQVKIKFFRKVGNQLLWIGEDTYTCEELSGTGSGNARVHFKTMDTPIQVDEDTIIAYSSPTGGISFSSHSTSYPCGHYFNSDIIASIDQTSLSTSNADTGSPCPIHASTDALGYVEINIDLGEPFKITTIELYMEQKIQKDFASIFTSVDGTNYIEWVDNEKSANSTGYVDGFDGHDSVSFTGTVRKVWVPINNAFRYARFKAFSSLYNPTGFHQLDFIADEVQVEFKASDTDLTVGNDAVNRINQQSMGNFAFIDLTSPANKTGYIYGIQFYGKIAVGDTYVQVLSFEKVGDIYKVVDRQLIKKIPKELIVTDKLHQWVLLEPLKIFQGNYLGFHAESGYTGGNLFVDYDSDATATTPRAAVFELDGFDNVGDAGMGAVTPTNGVTLTEDWTVKCVVTDPLPVNQEWEVEGSISGVMASRAITGQNYISPANEVSFLISAGTIQSALNDTFYFSTREQGSAVKFNQVDIEALGEGDQIDATLYSLSTETYNFAIEAWQEPYINELWIDDADAGGIGDSETLRIHNRSGALAQQVKVDILEAEDGSHDFIELSTDDIIWHAYGTAGIPLSLPDIPAGSFEIIYVRSNLPSVVDRKYETKLRTKWRIQV